MYIVFIYPNLNDIDKHQRISNMRIVKLTFQGINDNGLIQTTVMNINNKKYHNLRHGTAGRGLWEWVASVDNKHFPVVDDVPLILDRDDYILIPITNNKEISKDAIGNVRYLLSRDTVESHRTDMLVLWELPIKNFKKITTKLNGDVIMVGNGYNGKYRPDRKQRISAPILEITGDCNISWRGYTYDGDVYQQEISYINGTWDINPPITHNKD